MSACPGFFPTPLPDETLHSLISRYFRLSGVASVRRLLGNATHRAAFIRNTAFPCQLEALENLLGSMSCLRADDMIANHTLLPYFKPFLTPEQLTAALQQMKQGNGQGLKMRLGLIASTLESQTRVRFCPQCLMEDDQSHGQAYWHRVHQLPGVWVCPHHAKVLWCVDSGWIRHKAQPCYLPDDDDIQQHAMPLPIELPQNQALVRLAALSWCAFCSNASPQPSERLRHNLCNGARPQGLLSSNGRLRLKPLGEMLSEYFHTLPAAGEFLRLAPSTSGLSPSWALKLLRKPRLTHHPLKYLILADVLGLNFEALCADSFASVNQPEPHRPSDRAAKVNNGCLKDLYDQGYSLRQMATAAGVSVSTLHVWAVQQGLSIKARPKTLLPAVLEHLREQALEGHAVCEIATHCNVSLPTVYRVMRMEPGLKVRWSQVRGEAEREHRRLRFKSEYRSRRVKKCTDYGWLYRHDQAWLQQEIRWSEKQVRPHTPVVDWPALDRTLSDKIADCVAMLKARPCKPMRISIALIGRELQAKTLFEKQLDHLPLCASQLTVARESQGQFQTRRLQWAAQALKTTGRSIGASRLLRYAGIRKPEKGFEELLRSLVE